ncbi:hypothetical protein [Hyalangium rubrum]|uniref:Uncharacterized protein n=1 Tax=Hyalangium rubrum TaxID=3103134 RepID=A0ABU5HEV1_9BACT|nr:hypothetical protein [Hyalangium sp. s54d21]MDY7231328.1 hypothetical protein [Hyalangium sp. s54d21]
MTSAELFSGEDFEAEAGMDEFSEFSDAFEDLDGFEEEDAFGELDGFEEDGFEALFSDEGDGFEQDLATGLYVPSARPRLVTGPAAMVLARSLNPFVLDSMDSDDAEAFFRRIARGVRGAVRGVARGVRRVGRVAMPILRRAAPLLRRALPIIQRVASVAGPWGRVVSAGIGAAQGLLQGRGLRGAVAGAVGGLIPGVGGRIASSLLRGDGADDDASLDALADMADARQVPAAVALPMGAGLAARVVARQAVPPGTPMGAAAQGVIRARTRGLEQYLMRVAQQVQGSPGRRLRVLRTLAQLAARNLRRRGPGAAINALPQVTQAAARRVLARAHQSPRAGTVPPQVAAQRLIARQRVLRRVPVATVSTASARQALT